MFAVGSIEGFDGVGDAAITRDNGYIQASSSQSRSFLARVDRVHK